MLDEDVGSKRRCEDVAKNLCSLVEDGDEGQSDYDPAERVLPDVVKRESQGRERLATSCRHRQGVAAAGSHRRLDAPLEDTVPLEVDGAVVGKSRQVLFEDGEVLLDSWPGGADSQRGLI